MSIGRCGFITNWLFKHKSSAVITLPTSKAVKKLKAQMKGRRDKQKERKAEQRNIKE